MRRATILIVAVGLLCAAVPAGAKTRTTIYRGTLNGLDGSTADATYKFKGSKLTLTVNAHFNNCNPAGSGRPTNIDFTYTKTTSTHTDPAGTGFEISEYGTASTAYGPAVLSVSAFGGTRGHKLLALLTIHLNSAAENPTSFGCNVNGRFKPMSPQQLKKKHKKHRKKK